MNTMTQHKAEMRLPHKIYLHNHFNSVNSSFDKTLILQRLMMFFLVFAMSTLTIGCQRRRRMRKTKARLTIITVLSDRGVAMCDT